MLISVIPDRNKRSTTSNAFGDGLDNKPGKNGDRMSANQSLRGSGRASHCRAIMASRNMGVIPSGIPVEKFTGRSLYWASRQSNCARKKYSSWARSRSKSSKTMAVLLSGRALMECAHSAAAANSSSRVAKRLTMGAVS